MAEAPRISIVVPSHNRKELLRQVLDALAAQEPETPPFELVIVADGCRDGTQDMVAAYQAPFPVRLLESPGVGPSKARNLGAEHATAELLLFLDDDVIPTPRLVAAHWAAHRDHPGSAVLGPYPPETIPALDPSRRNAQRWWKAHFDELARPGHRFSYIDLLTGNLSLDKATWAAVGGLDPQFARAREDLELGVRLMKHGVPFHYAPEAIGWHQEHLTTSPRSMLHRVKEEGRSDALMAIKHPEMRATLAICRRLYGYGRKHRYKLALLRRARWLDRLILATGHRVLAILSSLGLPGLRRQVEQVMRDVCYQRGAAEALGNGLSLFAGKPIPAPPRPEAEIELADGLEAAESSLDQLRPASVRLLFEGREIAVMPTATAAEPWRARHLRPFLARQGKVSFAPVLASHLYGSAERPWISPDADRAFGVTDFHGQLREAQSQWHRRHAF